MVTPEQAAFGQGQDAPGSRGIPAGGGDDSHDIHITYNNHSPIATEDAAGRDLARQAMAMQNADPQTGSR